MASLLARVTGFGAVSPPENRAACKEEQQGWSDSSEHFSVSPLPKKGKQGKTAECQVPGCTEVPPQKIYYQVSSQALLGSRLPACMGYSCVGLHLTSCKRDRAIDAGLLVLQRHRICLYHGNLPGVVLDGKGLRWCQQVRQQTRCWPMPGCCVHHCRGTLLPEYQAWGPAKTGVEE
jgi:hypothetical protein